VAAWWEAPYFTAAERAALALAEAATRLSDRADRYLTRSGTRPAGHYDEQRLAAPTLMIAVTNLSTASTPTPKREPALGATTTGTHPGTAVTAGRRDDPER
jgi:alkylhydroperoxidase family enzyme